MSRSPRAAILLFPVFLVACPAPGGGGTSSGTSSGTGTPASTGSASSAGAASFTTGSTGGASASVSPSTMSEGGSAGSGSAGSLAGASASSAQHAPSSAAGESSSGGASSTGSVSAGSTVSGTGPSSGAAASSGMEQVSSSRAVTASSAAGSTSSTAGMASSAATPASSGQGAASSSTGGGTCAPPDALDGPPVTAPDNTWTWVPVDGAVCRNGSATGFGIRRNPASDKLVIYLEGGGACFNGVTCQAAASSFGSSNFTAWASGAGNAGLFTTTQVTNPVRDWNAVYIPYCTGDAHGGSATGVNVPGSGAPQNQSFVGYRNMGLFMARIIPTFPGITRVLLTGASTGGLGALLNYDRVALDFCPRPVVLVDDSWPPMADTYLAPCLQQRWRTLWNMDAALTPWCPQASGPDGGGMVNAVTCLGQRYADGRLGLISTTQDAVVAQFYGHGQSNCANLDGFAQPLPGATYAAGLADLRSTHLGASPAWGTFLVTGTTHTFLRGNAFFSTTVGDASMTQWVGDLVSLEPAADVGP